MAHGRARRGTSQSTLDESFAGGIPGYDGPPMFALPAVVTLAVLSAEPKPVALREAMQSAVSKHPTVLTARANMMQSHGQVDQFEGVFTPTLVYRGTVGALSGQSTNSTAPNPPNQLLGTLDADVAIVGTTRTGGRYRGGVRALNYSIDSLQGVTAPSLQVVPQVQFAQPLLRGRGEEPTLAQLNNATAFQLSAKSALIRAQLDAAAAAADRYWEWTFQRAGVQIAETSLRLAREALELTRAKAKAGAISPLEVAQAEATVAEREADLLSAERQVLSVEEEVLRTSYLHVSEIKLGERISPLNAPRSDLPTVTMEAAIEVAMANRPEVAATEALIKGQQALVAGARNNVQYRVDAVASAGYGIGGQNAAGTGFGQVVALFPTGPYATVGLEGDLPFNRQTPRGQLEQSIAELERRQTTLYEVRNNISLEVRTAVLQLESDRERVVATAEAERLARANLEAEQKKFNGGITTIFDVLRVQADLARAQSNSMRALANFNTAWARLKKAQGTLLEDVTGEAASSP